MSASALIYDSGSVAAGAVITTGVLGFSQWAAGSPKGIEVVVDNSAGDALRDLTLATYLDDGTTAIDTVILRKVHFGAKPTGATHTSSVVRGYIGPNPPDRGQGSHVLHDATSAANAALDTGILSTEDMDCVSAYEVPSGASSAAQFLSFAVDDAGTSLPLTFNTATANANPNILSIGGMASAGTVTFGTHTHGIAVPRRLRFTVAACGAGITSRLVVYGRGRVPGTFAFQTILPTRFKLTLAAAGTGAARMTVYGA